MYKDMIYPKIETVFREFRTCEFTTVAKDGTPVSWPTVPFYQPEKNRFFIATSIGLPMKAFNVRRNPRVSLLFSDPTGYRQESPSAVLVQGDAEAPDKIITDLVTESKEAVHELFTRQPAAEFYSNNPVTRYLFDWYYMRLPIYITPRRILWWDRGDFNSEPYEYEMEMSHVE